MKNIDIDELKKQIENLVNHTNKEIIAKKTSKKKLKKKNQINTPQFIALITLIFFNKNILHN